MTGSPKTQDHGPDVATCMVNFNLGSGVKCIPRIFNLGEKVMKKVILLAVLFCFTLSSSFAFAGAKRVNVHMAFGTDVLIIANKTVSLRAECILDDGGVTEEDPLEPRTVVRLYATTTSSTGTVMDGADNFDGNLAGDFLLPTTLPEDAELMRETTEVGTVDWDNDTSEGFVLDTSDLANSNKAPGLAVEGDTAIFGLTADGCYISVAIEKIKKFKDKD